MTLKIPVTATIKRCSRCDMVKFLDEFNRYERNKDGRRPSCRECDVLINAKRVKSQKPYTNERIPVSVLGPLVLRWAKENTIESTAKSSWNAKGVGWQQHLSKLSGVGIRTIWRVTNGGGHDARRGMVYDHVTFDTADKLTSAMECNQEWTSGVLAPYYGPLSVKPYERDYEQPLYEVAA